MQIKEDDTIMQVEPKTLNEFFGAYLADEGQKTLASLLRIQNVEIFREEKRMRIKALAEQMMAPSDIDALGRSLEEGLGGGITVELEAGMPRASDAETLEDAWSVLRDEVNRTHPMIGHIFRMAEASVEENTVRLVLTPSMADLVRHSGELRNLEDSLRNMTGVPVGIVLEEKDEDREKIRKEREKREAEGISQALFDAEFGTAEKSGNAGAKGSGSILEEAFLSQIGEDVSTVQKGAGEETEDGPAAVVPDPQKEGTHVPTGANDAVNAEEHAMEALEKKAKIEEYLRAYDEEELAKQKKEAGQEDEEEEDKPVDEVLVGSSIRGKITELSAVADGKRCIVYGVLTSVSAMAVKNDKMLVRMVLTDYKHDLSVKAFIPNDQYASVQNKLKAGATFMMRGTCRLDTFDHELTLMANHIMLCAADFPLDEATRQALSEMIWGNPFEVQKPTELKHSENTRGMITVKGEVIMCEAEERGTGRMSVLIDITDYTGSETVSLWTDKDTYNKMAGSLKPGKVIQVLGQMEETKNGAKQIYAKAIRKLNETLKPKRTDTAERKRVELHIHTKMSEMDAVANPADVVKQAAAWGHPAVAITDHGAAQGFPEAMTAAEKLPVKVLYGLEAYLVDDEQEAVRRDKGQTFSDTFVVFDIETTGFNKEKDQIIEIGAVKVVNGEETERFSEFINPGRPIPEHIVKLTRITDDDVKDAGPIETVLPRFLEFVGGSVLVAHNAGFDTGFIETKARDLGLPSVENTVVDTLALARGLYNTLTRYTLDALCRHLGVKLENHHRAVDDAGATVGIFLKCAENLKDRGVEKLADVNELIRSQIDVKRLKAYHAILLVRNLAGLRNLYELISLSHLQYFNRVPRLPKSEINRLRDGLILGSACEAGELFQAVLEEDGPDVIEHIVNYYDYLEIQPICNNEFLIRERRVPDEEGLRDLNRRIVALGEQYDKPVVATCDAHFINKEDGIFRKILLAGKGFSDADRQADLYFRTTDEMLEEFGYLGREKAEEVVIDNTLKIADMVEVIKPIPDGTFTPKIPGAEQELPAITHKRAHEIYGEELPEIVEKRLDRELGSIIKNGYASLYIIAERLVKKSNSDGYVVGSRGSVGSSFVATMAGITEVNPLPAHYQCPHCRYSEFDSEEIRENGSRSGFDLPDKACPRCGTLMRKEGHNIPFETFLGFDGDKEPDIDLNFSGEYQPRAHAFTEEMFGKGQVFRAGTVTGMAEKTAFGYVKKYLEERGIPANRAEINRLAAGCTGVRRTTGQHPGGQIIVPKEYSIYQFCPIQYPANKVDCGIITTQFDYNQLHGRLLKMDILGHDDPTMMRMLCDLTNMKVEDIPLSDKKVMSIFQNTEALGVTPEQIGSTVGTYGIPEFGTNFTRQMLVETKPQCFTDLCRISGLSHGTDVWNNNAQELIHNGTASISEVISTRDDVMTYLIAHGLENLYAFKTMEAVRKGRGLSADDEKKLKEAGVPEWYIRSCQKIKYLFPKGHATAYVIMGIRVAYFKVYHKEAYYAAYFSIRGDGFDYETMCRGEDAARAEKARIEALGRDASDKEKDKLDTLDIVIEAYCRGVQFAPISIEKSGAERFKLLPDGRLLPPFTALPGLGAIAARSVVEARTEKAFMTIDDLLERSRLSKTMVDQMRQLHLLDDLPESMQISLF